MKKFARSKKGKSLVVLIGMMFISSLYVTDLCRGSDLGRIFLGWWDTPPCVRYGCIVGGGAMHEGLAYFVMFVALAIIISGYGVFRKYIKQPKADF